MYMVFSNMGSWISVAHYDEEICKKVRDLVYSDRRIQVEEIAQTLGNSLGSISTVLHDRLGIRKLGSPNPLAMG